MSIGEELQATITKNGTVGKEHSCCRPDELWELSFSQGRALQQPALHARAGKRETFLLRSGLLLARRGTYEAAMEKE